MVLAFSYTQKWRFLWSIHEPEKKTRIPEQTANTTLDDLGYIYTHRWVGY